ncbi:MerR family transcriptional regulator [Clostridium sp. C8-1-8]|uniref:MerR family transcriptional regulator n=1 Tax=Clostridium sp. C8-1-8 TaxID=2698831 RepID=UPI001369A35B|nr:MerR family transcriptional regulator [Clostridium sp. C8-1-8]
MELMTISEVSRSFNISTRTLRYYEQIGLIESKKKEDYAYRVYDEAAIKRMKQIVVLRKLRISLKQIKAIFEDNSKSSTVDIFTENLLGLNHEITSLTTIKEILELLIQRLKHSVKVGINFELLENEDVLKIVEPLCLSTINIKGERSMEQLNRANENLNKLQDREVRIIYIPPAAVASIHCSGGFPEMETGNLLHEFIKETKLYDKKPDFRHFGFNNPNGNMSDGSDHGYERWITIPENFEVRPPFTKKHLAGGLYCAHMIPMGAFDEWAKLYNWAENNDKYDLDLSSEDRNSECMEEHLNYINKYMLSPEDSSIQLDLLLPVKEK